MQIWNRGIQQKQFCQSVLIYCKKRFREKEIWNSIISIIQEYQIQQELLYYHLSKTIKYPTLNFIFGAFLLLNTQQYNFLSEWFIYMKTKNHNILYKLIHQQVRSIKLILIHKYNFLEFDS
ncbi:hypothetical protein pb186bvf_012757 [Paramecium bursaria]